MAVRVAALALLVLAVGAAADCSDHGALVEGKCVCSNPRPSEGQQAWVGDQCEIPVHEAAPSVSGPAADAVAAASLGPLQPSETICFFSRLVGGPLVNYGLRLQATDNAMLDLHGLLTADDKVYPNSATQNNFVLSTTCDKSHAFFFLEKQHGQDNALFSCVTNKGTTNATFALRLAGDQCPFDIQSDGNKTVCSGNGACEAGACICTGEWARPQAPVYPGLGFDQCSASSKHLVDGSKQHVNMQMPGTWYFYNFTVAADSADRFVTALLTATDNTTSDVELYLKYWQAPGRSVSQYDLRSDPGDFRRPGSTADLASSIHLSSGSTGYRPGIWFLGVFVNGNECVSYDLQLVRSSCPNGCSGEDRGTCAADTGVCTCKDEAAGADCSQTRAQLQVGSSQAKAPRTGFTYDHYQVPVGDLLSKAPGHSLSLEIQASFQVAAALPAWVTARPMLLVSGSFEPGIGNATLRTSLQNADASYSITVSAQEVHSGVLYVTIYNPINEPYAIGYSVSASTTAACINGCSGHGTCGASDGVCSCQSGFAGPDCSVDVDQIKRSQPCIEGSLREQPSWGVKDSKGYAVCVCSTPDQCAFTDTQSYVVCGSGFTLTGANPTAIKLSDGRTVPAGGTCKKPRIGTSGGMVFFYCLLSIVLFCGAVVGSKFGLERYQIWRANQVQGYNELGTNDNKSLWDAFTGARRTSATDSW